MSEQGREQLEIPKDMRAMAEASVDQARKTFEKFITNAQAAADSFSERSASVRAGAKDANAMALSYAAKNTRASFDYAESLLHAKDLSEALRLHTEYVQAQMRSLSEQAGEMGQLVSRTAMEAVRSKH